MPNEPTGTEPSPTPTPPTEPTPTPPVEPTPNPNPTPAPSNGTSEFVPLTAEDLSFPEGAQVSEPLRDEFLTLLNDREMSPKDQAGKLVELSGKVLAAASEANSAAWDKMQADWQTEAKTALGDKFQTTLESVGKLVEEFGSPELRQVLDLTGAGNNIHVIQFYAKIAEKLTEGGTAPLPGAPAATTSAAKRMFPSMN